MSAPYAAMLLISHPVTGASESSSFWFMAKALSMVGEWNPHRSGEVSFAAIAEDQGAAHA